MPTDINVTTFDDDLLTDVNGLLISHPEDGVVSGTGGYTPFLRQNANDGSTQGFNTSDADTLNDAGTEGLDMDKAWTVSLKVGDLPIVYIEGVAYYEIRLDLNEENSGEDAGGEDAQLLELSEFQIYTSTQQATLDDYTAGSGTVLDGDFNLVYDLDAGEDRSLILIDGPSGSGNDDYAFYIPVSDVGSDPNLYFTLFAQFGPQPAEGATFEEFRIQNTAVIDGVKFSDVDGDGIRDAGEAGLEGFVMYIDANGNNLLDLGEVTATSDSDGAFTFYGLTAGTYVVREILSEDDLSAAVKAAPGYVADDYLPPNGFWELTTGLGGDHEIQIVLSGKKLVDATVEVGNHELDPSVDLTKSASVDGDCADTVGELVNYTINVFNDGDTDLTNVVVTDDFADVGSIEEVDEDNDTFNDGDTNEDGKLNPGETWQYTAYHTVTQDDIDNNGNYDSSDPPDGINDVLRNVATVNADSEQTDSTVTDSDDATVEVCQDPVLGIEKSASVDGDCVDTVGELVNYTILVTNEGNVGLENVVVTDDMADPGSLDGDADNNGFIDGDVDEDGVLDLTETWTYTAYHTVTQDDIDNNGNYDSSDPPDGINDVLRNVATANATALTTGTAAEEVTDDATVEVCQDPAIDLEKYVNVDPTTVPPDASDVNWDDADTDALAPENVNLGTDVWFKVTVENTGNVTLTDVDIVDNNQTGGLPGTFFDLVVDGELTADAINNHGATLAGDTDGDHQLDVDETWTIIYSQAFDFGDHVNEATVTADATTTGTTVTDSDLAHYFSLVDQGLCPRTPGFWQNPNNGAQFWDGVAGNEKNLGKDGFPVGELLYDVDSDGDGNVNVGVKGLLIGDYDHDGTSKGEDGILNTADDEDVIFVSYADAQTLINASNKQLNGSSGDGRFMLGRDMVASWLNYLQGSGFGDASDPESPHHYLDDAIDWMQIYSGKNAGTDETYDILKINGSPVKTSAAIWKDAQSGFDHSAAQMHSALDYYNNTGQTEPGGTHYANCEDQHLLEALRVYEGAHPDLV